MFSQSNRKTYKKAISDGVNVSVVLDVGQAIKSEKQKICGILHILEIWKMQ